MKKIATLLSPFLCMILISSPIMAEDVFNPSTSYGNSTNKPGSRVNRARGHDGDKEHVYSGDVLNGVYGRGYDGVSFSSSDRIAIEEQAAEDWTTTANGTKIVFKTTPALSVTPATVLTIGSSGSVTPTGGVILPTVDITITSPTVAGVMFQTSAHVVYISTNATDLQGWVKVGGQ